MRIVNPPSPTSAPEWWSTCPRGTRQQPGGIWDFQRLMSSRNASSQIFEVTSCCCTWQGCWSLRLGCVESMWGFSHWNVGSQYNNLGKHGETDWWMVGVWSLWTEGLPQGGFSVGWVLQIEKLQIDMKWYGPRKSTMSDEICILGDSPSLWGLPPVQGSRPYHPCLLESS